MRVVIVTAHFPPNFVSGGTLAPQRLAVGLRDEGHDVRVYSGWFGDGRPALETWDEPDASGVPVRWIVTTPWTAWDVRENFDNPTVAADFGAWASDVRPDVVHIHSLQSLGAGLVDAAVAAGAKVVVTMHDFWWTCARQFLVTRDYQPCCWVVDAGDCPCELGRPWLDERNRRLRAALERVDLVLAPSASSAELLAANGVDPARLAVDENGMPEAGNRPGPPRPRAGRPLTFLYLGGWNPMKGAAVLVDAAKALGPRPGWRLVTYGMKRLVDEGLTLADLPVEIRPPFSPEDIDAVYAEADVLVLPSVMRESHSLATREALSRGVPVITTDSLGPEEVVEHGRNGLVVSAADAEALAAAMSSLLDDPGLLNRLRAGGGTVELRTVDDQVRSLAGRYRELLAPSSPPPTTTRPIRRVVFACGIEGAPLRYRARLPAEGLELLGVSTEVRHYRDSELPALVDGADALVVYRVPATVQVLALIDQAHGRGMPVLFDVDDLIFDPEVAPEIPALQILPPAEADLWMQGVKRYRTTMEACDGFIGSTDALCRHATEVTGLPAYRFGNGVGTVLGRLSDRARARPRRPGPVRVGYLSGTTTHDHDWAHVEAAVLAALDRHPGSELWLVGPIVTSDAVERLGPRLVRMPMQAWDELPERLRDLDVNLAPLAPGSRFNESKSAIKWLEAALTGTVTVASPTQPFREVIRDGENGVLAGEPAQWEAAVDRLLVNETERRRLGRRANRDALVAWSPHRQGRHYLDVLERAAAAGPAKRSSTWAAVVHDEPWIVTSLEPYGSPGRAMGAQSRLGWKPRPQTFRWWVARAWATGGPRAAARTAAAMTLRRLGLRKP